MKTILSKNIIPYVEKNYRAITNRDSRAIGGFSRGGGQTLRTAFGIWISFPGYAAIAAYLSQQEMESSYTFFVEILTIPTNN